MACAVGRIGSSSSSSSCSSSSANVLLKRRKRGGCGRVMCVSTSSYSSSGLTDQYKTLRIQPGASELEVKKAFRQLALQYHPDVCKGSNCGVQFHRINEAYDIVMTNLRASKEEEESSTTMQAWGEDDDQTRGMYDSSWDLWEEWMGFEGACTRDYSSHINPDL